MKPTNIYINFCILLFSAMLTGCASESQIEKHDTGKTRSMCLGNTQASRDLCHEENSKAAPGPGIGDFSLEGASTEEMLRQIEIMQRENN